MSGFASGAQGGVSFSSMLRAGRRQRIVPDGSNAFYVIARNDRGTTFAHRFLRNQGGSDGTDTGAPWPNWRYVGTAELPGFDSAPTDPARFVYSDDIGAQDYAMKASANGLYMGSYHGGAALDSEVARMDGEPVDPLFAASGSRFSLTHNVTLTSGASILKLTFEVSVSPSDGSLTFAVLSSSSTAAFSNIFLGMGLVNGANYDSADIILTGGTQEFTMPIGVGVTYLGQARSMRLRDSATGRAILVRTNAPSQASYRRGYIVRTGTRTKWYAEGATGAFATKAGIVWTVRFETGSAAVTVPGPNLLTNGSFASDLGGWTATMTGGSVDWTAGKLRATRGTSLDNRISQPVETDIGGIYLLSGEMTTTAGLLSALGLTNSAMSTSSPAPAYAPVAATIDGYAAHLVIATATTSYAMMVQSPGTAGQTTDFDNIALIRLAPTA